MEHFLIFYEYKRTMRFISPFFLQMLLLLILTKSSFTQIKLSGTWRGAEIMDSSGTGAIFETKFKIIGGLADGHIKVESQNNDFYIRKIKGSKKYIELKLKESDLIFSSSKKTENKKTFELIYNLSTGYLESNYDSSRQSRIVLFQEDFSFNPKTKSIQSQNWVASFIENYRSGISAPKKRLQELREFKFVPIYFDVDQAVILEHYHAQLVEIIKITKSHSDLRIQVTGHTDSDGSKSYNRNLSKRRAESIIKFFTKRGLRRDRIVIEFKGESEPVETNKTKEGKQKNRRVDFRFI